jgi:MoxR-like ATPase
MLMSSKEFGLITRLRENIESVIFGKQEKVKLLISALLAQGHVLIEDTPGVGKTALARALARSIDCSFKRIQFTPDLLPSDITGLAVFDPNAKDFVFKPGPIFANIILADEINRSAPRIQSALLEAMNEKQVSQDGNTHSLPTPFMVIATQNPIEFIGTYPLPESQLDRFIMLLDLGYPTAKEEFEILLSRRRSDPIDTLNPVLSVKEISELCSLTTEIRVDNSVSQYIVELVHRTRDDESLITGISPRGAIHLTSVAQGHAFVAGRDYVTPDDVKAVAVSVLSHRLVLRQTGSGIQETTKAAQVVQRIVGEVAVPQ